MGSRSTVCQVGGQADRRRSGTWFRTLVGLAGALAATFAPISRSWAQDAPIQLIRDTEVEEILHKDADPILRAAGIDPKAVTIYIIGDDDLNAFVSGGQNLFLFTGMIARTKNPNQLQGVMAHEIGHMAGGHLIRSDMGEKQELATYILTMGLGVLAAVAGSPDAAAGLLYSSGYFAALTGAGFTRTQESSADQAAITYLEKAGLSGKGIVDFFDNYRYEEVFENARRYKFFQDHPISSDRVEALRVRAEQQPHYGAVDSPQAQAEHEVMVAKLKAFEDLPAQTLIDYPESDTSFPARYARAIAYYRDLQTDRALKLTDALIADQPNNPYLWELKGQILFESGHPADAEPAHRRSVELKPAAPILHMNLAQALLAEENPQKLAEAVAELHRALNVEPDNAGAWMLMAQAYDRQGQPGMARLASAEQEFALGQLADAKTFAMRARRQLVRNSPEWRRATDIVLVSNPTKQDLQALAQEGGAGQPIRR
jgi:predicted Zn-dependent protease